MFNLNDYLKESPDRHVQIMILNGNEYKIKRLDGIILLQLQDIPETDKKFTMILANCLLDGTTEKPIGEQAAQVFLRNNLPNAVEIIHRIIDLSDEIRALENTAMERNRKNL